MSSVRNKVVLITGGARGQGAVEGALFSNLGSTVILTDVLDTEGQNIADSLECTYLHHDVSDESHWERVVTQIVEQFGQILAIRVRLRDGVAGRGEWHVGP